MREVAHVALGGVAQFLGQVADLLVARAALQRLAQPLLGGAQIALGLRGVAVFDLNRHRPQQIGDLDEIGIAARRREPRLRGAQAEIHAGGRLEESGAMSRASIALARRGAIVVGIEDQAASLLDQRARERDCGNRAAAG